MKNIQIILNSILSKNVFEYILINRNLKIIQTSLGIFRYLDHMPKEGDDIISHIPEFSGCDEEIRNVFNTKNLSYTFQTVAKNGYYINLSVDHYDTNTALVLVQNITEVTESQQKLLQYSNEITLLNKSLQKIIDGQNALLFVTNNQNMIEFANKKFLWYFNIETQEELQTKDIKLYKYISNTLNSYNDLYEYIQENEDYIVINNDTFILEATSIETVHKLFTLSKVTDIVKKKEILQKEVELDSLTQLYRKKYFDLKLEALFKYDTHFALIVIDIDNFKMINDTYGHAVGDEVLQEFATLLKYNIRKDDFIARWGGEEFLITYLVDDLDEALLRSQKLCNLIANHSFKKVGHLTASFGVAWRETSDDIHSLLLRADKALYKAKSSGKNRVILKNA